MKSSERYDPDLTGSQSDIGSGAGLRVMMYMHDTLGLGRFRRGLKISRALKAAYPELSILIATGSPQSYGFSLPDGVRIAKLPSLKKTGDSDYQPRAAENTKEDILEQRARTLIESAMEFSPHIFIADHSHLSMNNEIIPCLIALENIRNRCVKILGIRGIIDEAEKVIRKWNDANIYDVLKNVYDYIFIYNSPIVFDPVAAYQFPSDVKEKTICCGYITDFTGEIPIEVSKAAKPEKTRPIITVTIGGGEYWGEIIIGNFLKALKANRSSLQFDSIIVTGPFIPDDLWNRFKAESEDLPVEILRFTPEIAPYIEKSELVISTGGYNAVTDILSYAKKAIVIPRVLYRQEQLIRAERLSELGLVKFIHPDAVTPESLYEQVISMIEDKSSPLSAARRRNDLKLDGASRLTKIIGMILADILKIKEKMS